MVNNFLLKAKHFYWLVNFRWGHGSTFWAVKASGACCLPTIVHIAGISIHKNQINTQEMINSLELISVGNSHCCKCLESILYGQEFNLTVSLFFYEVCVVRMFSKHRFLKHKLKKCSKELQKVALSSHCW